MQTGTIRLFAAASLLVLVAGIVFDSRAHSSDLRLVGATGLLIALGEWRLSRSPRATAAYELGHMEGFRAGYDECRQQFRPTVVSLTPGEAVNGGHFPAIDRRRIGSAMRKLPQDVDSAECATAGGDSPT
jgi:hypothetical protein